MNAGAFPGAHVSPLTVSTPPPRQRRPVVVLNTPLQSLLSAVLTGDLPLCFPLKKFHAISPFFPRFGLCLLPNCVSHRTFLYHPLRGLFNLSLFTHQPLDFFTVPSCVCHVFGGASFRRVTADSPLYFSPPDFPSPIRDIYPCHPNFRTMASPRFRRASVSSFGPRRMSSHPRANAADFPSAENETSTEQAFGITRCYTF